MIILNLNLNNALWAHRTLINHMYFSSDSRFSKFGVIGVNLTNDLKQKVEVHHKANFKSMKFGLGS